MLALNDTQAGVLSLVFKIADDNGLRIGNSNAPQSPTTRPQPAKTGRLRQ
jgi:hypothetical protein